MVEVSKKEKESLESMLRRFKRKLQKSGKIFRVRRGRFFQRPLSRQLKTRKAIRRIKKQEQQEMLKKMGKFPSFDR